MKTTDQRGNSKIEVLFRKYSDKILGYIRSRINNQEDAENLSQDVWMRLLETTGEICEETVGSYIYRIATNIINDYLRNLYNRMGAREELLMTIDCLSDSNPELELNVKQLSELESKRIECLPSQRRIIYTMSRFEEKTVGEIASQLSLSFRTVENHLRLGRRDVRDYMWAIA